LQEKDLNFPTKTNYYNQAYLFPRVDEKDQCTREYNISVSWETEIDDDKDEEDDNPIQQNQLSISFCWPRCHDDKKSVTRELYSLNSKDGKYNGLISSKTLFALLPEQFPVEYRRLVISILHVITDGKNNDFEILHYRSTHHQEKVLWRKIGVQSR